MEEHINVVKLCKNRKPKNLIVLFKNNIPTTTFNENELLYTQDEKTILDNGISNLKEDYAPKNKDNYDFAVENNWYSESYSKYYHQSYDELNQSLLDYLANYDHTLNEYSVYINVSEIERLLDREPNVFDSRIPTKSKFPNADIITIRDPNNGWFLNKINQIGDTFLETSRYIKKMIEPYTRVVFVGDNMNGFASILYGSYNQVAGVIATHAETQISFRVNNLYNMKERFVVLQPYLSAKKYISNSTNYYIHEFKHSNGKRLKENFYLDHFRFRDCCIRNNVNKLNLPFTDKVITDDQRIVNTEYLTNQINKFFPN